MCLDSDATESKLSGGSFLQFATPAESNNKMQGRILNGFSPSLPPCTIFHVAVTKDCSHEHKE